MWAQLGNLTGCAACSGKIPVSLGIRAFVSRGQVETRPNTTDSVVFCYIAALNSDPPRKRAPVWLTGCSQTQVPAPEVSCGIKLLFAISLCRVYTATPVGQLGVSLKKFHFKNVFVIVKIIRTNIRLHHMLQCQS